MASFEFIPLKLKHLPLGVKIGCKIYYKRHLVDGNSGDGDYQLLCENQVITEELVHRLKRAIFPERKVYVPMQYVVETLFEEGHFLGFDEREVAFIRRGIKFWEKKDEPKRVELPEPAPKPEPLKLDKPIPKVNYFKDDVKELEEFAGKYDASKAEAIAVIEDAISKGQVDRNRGEAVAEDIKAQINTTSASLIVQAMNRIRNEDEYLMTHCLNVAYLNGLIGKWLKYEPERQRKLVETGLFHDLGKLGIAPEILNKPGKLTAEEFTEIKRHPILSMEMMVRSGMRDKEVLEGVVQHHEKVNGTGYPAMLTAKEICEFARITAISDIYDAMVTRRVYKEPHSPFVILSEFAREGYSELDITYVNVFINCMIDELKGKEIIMNDGREATILLINARRLLYPIVEIDGAVIETTDDFYCVRMKNILTG